MGSVRFIKNRSSESSPSLTSPAGKGISPKSVLQALSTRMKVHSHPDSQGSQDFGEGDELSSAGTLAASLRPRQGRDCDDARGVTALRLFPWTLDPASFAHRNHARSLHALTCSFSPASS